MRGKITSTITQAVFVAGVSMLIIALVVRQILVPTYEVYGEVQANMLAQSLASDISALWSQEEGEIERDLGGDWNILFEQKKGTFLWVEYYIPDGNQASKKAEILGNVQGDFVNLYNAANISIAKQAGKIEMKVV